MTPLNAVLRYRELLTVEVLFRRAKVQLRTRPIYHPCDAAISGHFFCSFLALVLRKELADRCRTAGAAVEWDDLIRDLDRLQEANIEKDGKRVTTRLGKDTAEAITGRCASVMAWRSPAPTAAWPTRTARSRPSARHCGTCRSAGPSITSGSALTASYEGMWPWKRRL